MNEYVNVDVIDADEFDEEIDNVSCSYALTAVCLRAAFGETVAS